MLELVPHISAAAQFFQYLFRYWCPLSSYSPWHHYWLWQAILTHLLSSFWIITHCPQTQVLKQPLVTQHGFSLPSAICSYRIFTSICNSSFFSFIISEFLGHMCQMLHFSITEAVFLLKSAFIPCRAMTALNPVWARISCLLSFSITILWEIKLFAEVACALV